MNKLLVTGRLVADPEVKQAASGVLMANIIVAVRRDFKDKKTGKYESDFLRFKSFDKTANFLDSYMKKGDQIEIEGSVINNNYEKDGKMVYQNEFIANRVSPLGSAKKTTDLNANSDTDEVPF